MNPLFVDSPTKDTMATNKLSEGDKRLMDDSRSSNRSEQCQTPSSSGYESAADADKRRPKISGSSAPHPKHQVINQSSQQEQQQQRHLVDNQRRHYQQNSVESSAASDYRRQFVLGPRLDRSAASKKATADVIAAAGPIPRRIGKANLLHQDSLYVTSIRMPASVAGANNNKPSSTGTDEASKHRPMAVVDEWDEHGQQAPISNDHPSTCHRSVPHPVWPSKSVSAAIGGRRGCHQAATSAIVQQNENYVTQILIAAPTDERADAAGRVASADDEDRGLDSIVTHSLLVMTSYDGQSTDDDTASDSSARPNGQQCNKEELCRIQIRMTPAELSEIGQLSQTMSQSRLVATVSRALSNKNSDASQPSCGGSTPEAYASYPASSSSKSSSKSSISKNEDDSATMGSSIARRISMMKERWDKHSRRQLLTESDDDDAAVASLFNRRLDQLYVPENGDVNFCVGHQQPQMAINDRRINGGQLCPGASPFSYLAGTYHPTTITEEPTATSDDNEVLVGVTPNRMCMPYARQTSYADPFEHDRLSNSSSRSSGSGSRRVTFSADTVDNEQSTKSTISTGSASSSSSVASMSGSTTASEKDKTCHRCPDIIEELKLNPHYLPHRYQQQPAPSVNADARSGRLAGYYSYNLQAQLDNYNRK